MPLDKHPSSAVWDYQPAPDVWWGADGIDALVWADGTPYAEPSGDGEPTRPAVPEVER
jgi:hypothetical protein